MKILILVLTYLDNGIYTNLYNKQNDTWNSIDVNGVDVFFNINGGDKKEIRDHFIINDLPEKIETEGYKVINCFEQTLNWEYDYIFHTNSSSYIDKQLLYNWLLDKPRKNFYSGVVGEYFGNKFASGCGFSLSKDVVIKILEHQDKWSHGASDDATLGVLLNSLNVPIYPAPRFDITSKNINVIPDNYFHYRCKTDDRKWDLLNFDKIFNLKIKNE
jgi:hypothetical protein